ncbi:lysophospholipid acyltransferase family protein [Halodesulfovibrio sp.]|uniref:lysophospholipid acyltransferase family protein n=1 Tax=Halodesulfovibrio sp. TaxID=1912772 RepID=UPI0025F561BD|nr:lysophospholipid acyltransferase family protein [Halodesulfovibrio sp.]MCT4534865.1 lysophospholipid acyltransferase family protein [Halodesulfovibrio sp.]
MKIPLPIPLISTAIYHLYKIWCKTLKYEEVGRERLDELWDAGTPMVTCLWHDELFPLMHARRQLEIIAVVSQSSDGEILAQVLEKLGLLTSRGSSSRGGVKALLRVAKTMRTSKHLGCITVDGPRGPRHEAKEGAVFIAHRSNAKIVPIRIAMENSYIFQKAWDKFQIPLPFSKVKIIFGEPYDLEEGKLSDEYLEKERQRLEDKLKALL